MNLEDIVDKVDVLLSVYDPDLEFLREQLMSINGQAYPDIEVFVYDDCVQKRTDRDFFYKYITKYPISFIPYSDKNIGYIKAFEKLTAASDGEYVAFCDQDDVWHRDKISRCVERIKVEKSLVVASNQRIIDENGDVVSDGAENKNMDDDYPWSCKDKKFLENAIVTSAPGMALVADGKFARSTVPFSAHTGHDKWILSCGAVEGSVSYIKEPLVDYRRHGNNTSGILIGVDSKKEYYDTRVSEQKKFVGDLIEKYGEFANKDTLIKLFDSRTSPRFFRLKKFYGLAPKVIGFEMVLSVTPNFLFKLIKRCISKMVR